MTKHKRRFVIFAVLMALTATPAAAMSGLEFMQLPDATAHKAVMDRIIVDFVAKGYRHVPDWVRLRWQCDAAIRDKGYRDKDIEQIAEEAAIANGMTK